MHPREIALSDPDRLAVAVNSDLPAEVKQLSYGELIGASDRCAGFLQQSGLKPGDTIALCLENRPEYFVICWAAFNLGLYFAPISTRLTAREIAYIVSDSGAKAFFTSAILMEQVRTLPVEHPDQTTWVMMDGITDGYKSYEEILASTDPIANYAPFQGAPMMYTSGTTGFPKGVKPPLATIPPEEPPKLLALLGRLYQFDGETSYLSTGPLYHAAPLKFNMAVHTLGGSTVVLRKFDPELALRSIQDYRITHSQWVPTMFNRLLRLPEKKRAAYDLSSHKVAIHAAAPCPTELKLKMLDWWGPIIYEYYAGSESVGLCAIGPEEWMSHQGSVGKAVKGEVHILDENENDLPPLETGLVFFANGGEFVYHNDPEKTARAHNSKGWATFGDIGHLDAEGYLYLTDRRDYVINSGGVNIYPQESEDILSQHPKVADVAVFGVPNADFGEEVKAVVQLAAPYTGSRQLAEELIDYCQQRLSKIKCPKSIDFLDKLPREPSGKLLKRKLQARYREQANTTR